MPKVALADSLLEWENLIATASSVSDEVPEMKPLLARLQTVLKRAQDLAARRDRLRGQLQQMTQQLNESKREGKFHTTRIHSLLKGIYGTTSPKLVGFGMKPRPETLPPRKKRAKPPQP
jgi:hypothetical protein